MQDRQHYFMKAFTWFLVFLVLGPQASASPVPSVDVPPSSGHLQPEGQRALKRMARMTPLWRTMGTKPYGAYCLNNYECSTGICRGGHCMFSQPIKS
ncbi:liver-expressed antimicrobial peptide 2-like [Oncorhynchus nerka]|uniref:Liver-expressed antimicrobial peptide 2 n=2 Tax=Oncorhynchus TaxID=8016 RepID=A0A8C7I8Y3_ONCKI|nr:liver-expressed antimicrobial peptide 2 [Oncorhynchus tshawytscha]XP_031647629.1 liver-expressed antimicrobial peptide 2-like [Oncorhynchus kisutch]XP_035616484.1 liver-expressed antimicrobial peptide 2 [Oncorhynchus keta]